MGHGGGVGHDVGVPELENIVEVPVTGSLPGQKTSTGFATNRQEKLL